MALHFVGFKDDRYWGAIQVFGLPDFYHRIWDVRARQEVAPGDTVVFAEGTDQDPPSNRTWDASQEDIRARGGKEFL